MIIRPLKRDDEPFLWHFLMLAAHETEVENVRAMPQLSRYVEKWGREGDSGFIALDEKGAAIGAAWLRLWTGENKGFGWIADDVPELAMAVEVSWRGRGVGTKLLDAVLHQARARHEAISLSARADNPAVRLYERAGFTKVPDSEIINRVGGTSFLMQIQL